MPEPNEAWKHLTQFPLVEAILAIFTAIAAGAAIFRGSWDNKPERTAPMTNGALWNRDTAREAVQIMREINENNRDILKSFERIETMMQGTGKAQFEAVHALERMERMIDEQGKGLRERTLLLEAIFNNQGLRGDVPRRRG